MKNKDKKDISIKKILLITLPLIIILIVVVIIKKNNTTDETQDKQANQAFLPDSEEDERVTDKVAAYKSEDLDNKRKEREKNESVVRNSDFFKEVSGDKAEIEENENVEEFYERTVVNKVGKNKQQTYSLNKPSKVSSSFYDAQEMDMPEVSTPNRTSSKTDSKKKESTDSETTTKITSGNKSSLQNRLNSYGKDKNQEKIKEVTELDESNPANYNRRRVRSTNGNENKTNLIKACIHDDQVATSGASIKMRMLEDCVIQNMNIPKNTIFYGIAQISNDRLNINVTNIKNKEQIVNVKFTIYDNDAIKGLNLPDNIKEELAKRTKESAINQVEAPAVGSGIIASTIKGVGNAAKSVIKKDNAQIKVPLKANYQIFINQSL